MKISAFIIALSVGILAILPSTAAKKAEAPYFLFDDIEKNACEVKNPDESSGSGVVIIRGGEGYVLTDGHVVERLKTGTPETGVLFVNTKVVKKTQDKYGEPVEESSVEAELITYNMNLDFAILKMKTVPNIYKDTRFKEEPVTKGNKIVYIGNFAKINSPENDGYMMMVPGHYSHYNRYNGQNRKFDFITLNYAVEGCSGGGIFTEKGDCVGLLVAKYSDTAMLINPVRKLKKWADNNNLPWVFDKKAKLPSAADLKKIPIENLTTEN